MRKAACEQSVSLGHFISRERAFVNEKGAGARRGKARQEKNVAPVESGFLDFPGAGTWTAPAEIHRRPFGDICGSAGEMRRASIAKGNSRCALLARLVAALRNIDGGLPGRHSECGPGGILHFQPLAEAACIFPEMP
ncbi:hypothetical protein [Fretibacterium sp. OH1220_COT-178]|uniref:hypothetical protein n=1 Tax=Fretibacterium sp. OH1220_COT-178 TaxID=2491047 RepID=UPI0013154B38|nr:hypothetical protein [Fretibacterium sp. OH1220_COT-178]